jgi:hypothetical protein
MTNTFTQYGARLGVTLNKINGNIAFEVGDTFSNGRHAYIIYRVWPKVNGLIYIDVLAGPLDNIDACQLYNFDHDFLAEEVIVDGWILFPWIGTFPEKANNHLLDFPSL